MTKTTNGDDPSPSPSSSPCILMDTGMPPSGKRLMTIDEFAGLYCINVSRYYKEYLLQDGKYEPRPNGGLSTAGNFLGCNIDTMILTEGT